VGSVVTKTSQPPPRRFPQRGDVWWGFTGAKRRPVLVISSDSMNGVLAKVSVIPGTTNLRGWPDEVLLLPGLLKAETAFCCRELTPIAITELTGCAGSVSDEWLLQCCSVLAQVFDCRPKT
jgi:mRNA-degrading endonuclease toxin of MazEF toxin-antitoxin module